MVMGYYSREEKFLHIYFHAAYSFIYSDSFMDA